MGIDLVKLLTIFGIVMFIGLLAQVRYGRSGIRWGLLTLVAGGTWWLLIRLIFVGDQYLSRYDPNVMAVCEILVGPVAILSAMWGVLKARVDRERGSSGARS